MGIYTHVTETAPAKKKRKKPISTTAMALAECRKRGWDADKVEQRLPRCFITRDLFGCIDIVALGEGTIIGLQVTGGQAGNHAARRAKAIAEPRLRRWLAAGGRFEVWSYALRGAKGKRKLYTLREDPVTLADLPAVGLSRQEMEEVEGPLPGSPPGTPPAEPRSCPPPRSPTPPAPDAWAL